MSRSPPRVFHRLPVYLNVGVPFLGRNDADQEALLQPAWQSAGLSRTTEVFKPRRSSTPGDRAPGEPYSSFRDLNAPDPTGSQVITTITN